MHNLWNTALERPIMVTIGVLAAAGTAVGGSFVAGEMTRPSASTKSPAISRAVESSSDSALASDRSTALGRAGAQGPQGPPGPRGPKGDMGLRGAEGSAGYAGAAGAAGTAGPQGAHGEPGATGATGAPGSAGAPGTKGDKGDPGDVGTIADGSITHAKLAVDAVDSVNVLDGSIAVADLAFDAATQAELDTHAAGDDHDARYYTKTQLVTADAGPNELGDLLDWSKLKNVPADIADGDADTTTATDVACTGCVGSTDIAANSVTSDKIPNSTIGASDIDYDVIEGLHVRDRTLGTSDLAQSTWWAEAHARGVLASRPAATGENNGFFYIATDVNGGTMYRSNGSSWDQVARGVSESATDLVCSGCVDSSDLAALTGQLNTVRATASIVLANKLAGGDTGDAFRLYGNGALEWGAGGAGATDTNLYRSQAGMLQTDGTLTVGSNVNVLGPGGYTGYSPAVNLFLRNYKSGGDSAPTYQVKGDGTIEWGSGAAVADTNLYRAGASLLATDDALNVGGRMRLTAGDGLYLDTPGNTYVHHTSATGSMIVGSSSGLYLSANDTNRVLLGGNEIRVGNPATSNGANYNLQAHATAASAVPLSAAGAAGQTANLFEVRETAAGTNAFSVGNTGTLAIGADANLYRSAADTLKTDDTLHVGGEVRAAGLRPDVSGANGLWTQTGTLQLAAGNGIQFGSALDTNLYRSAANWLRTDDSFLALNFVAEPSSASNAVFRTKTAADAEYRFDINGAGELQWGNGTAAPDTRLYRSGADTLRTDDTLVVPAAGTSGLGIKVGAGAFPLSVQSDVNNNSDSVIAHNATVSNDNIWRWNSSHATFGSRAIAFGLGAGRGIEFYADDTASTAGSTFTPTLRMSLTNQGRLRLYQTGSTGGLLIGSSDLYHEVASGNLRTSGGLTVDGALTIGTLNAANLSSPGTVTGESDGGAGAAFRVGNDAEVHDVNVANTMQLRGVGDPTAARLEFGSSGDTALYRNTTSQLRTQSMYLDNQLVLQGGATNAISMGSPTVFTLENTGTLNWGAAGTLDTNLYRASANVLRTDDAFEVVRDSTAAFKVAGSGGTSLIVDSINNFTDTSGSNELRVPGTVVRNGGSLGIDAYNEAPTQIRLHNRGVGRWADTLLDGQLLFGDADLGTSDTNLYRVAANSLKTDDDLTVAGTTTVGRLAGIKNSGSAALAANTSTTYSAHPNTVVTLPKNDQSYYLSAFINDGVGGCYGMKTFIVHVLNDWYHPSWTQAHAAYATATGSCAINLITYPDNSAAQSGGNGGTNSRKFVVQFTTGSSAATLNYRWSVVPIGDLS